MIFYGDIILVKRGLKNNLYYEEYKKVILNIVRYELKLVRLLFFII